MILKIGIYLYNKKQKRVFFYNFAHEYFPDVSLFAWENYLFSEKHSKKVTLISLEVGE